MHLFYVEAVSSQLTNAVTLLEDKIKSSFNLIFIKSLL